MRSLLLSLTTVGLMLVSGAPALAGAPHDQQPAQAAAYVTSAPVQAEITPVARFYYGRPAWGGWYGYRARPRYGYYYSPYYAYPYTYSGYPGYTYGYSYYPYSYYYTGPRVQFGFGF
jgi:hypothetical protein